MVVIQDLEEANRCIRELAGLSLLPAIWSGGKPDQIRENLADALQNSLRAEVVYVRGGVGNDDLTKESVRVKSRLQSKVLTQRLGDAVRVALGRGGSDLVKFSIEDHELRLAVISLGAAQEFGVFAVGVNRPDFPTSAERILLDFSINQTILAFRSARQMAALRRSEGNLRDFVENATVGLHWVNAKGIIIWANRAELNLLGYTSEEYIGRHVAEFHADTSVIEDILLRLSRGETILEYEARLRGKDGAIRDVLINSDVLFEKGEFIHTRSFTRDITERKRAEKAVVVASEVLEETVQERTAKLQETIAELEAFSYSISHDMRSPLRAMQGYADVLLERYKNRLDEKGSHYLERIQRGAMRLDLLIRDVLSYSKIAKGDVELEPLDLEAIISDVIENYPHIQAHVANITVAAPFPKVVGHEAYLTQIVSNLLGNAVKFVTPGKAPAVRVWAENGGPLIRIWFEDNGIGIDPRHHSDIFQIFGRVYSEKKFEGTGIGLAIVRKATERIGGSVGIESELGKGSRFWITLKKPA